eukprot:82205-Chlamydomonas_euryale.AAC.1
MVEEAPCAGGGWLKKFPVLEVKAQLSAVLHGEQAQLSAVLCGAETQLSAVLCGAEAQLSAV